MRRYIKKTPNAQTLCQGALGKNTLNSNKPCAPNPWQKTHSDHTKIQQSNQLTAHTVFSYQSQLQDADKAHKMLSNCHANSNDMKNAQYLPTAVLHY